MATSEDRQARQLAVANAVINVLLTIVKAVVGILSSSEALIADAVHSGADVVGSIAVIIGLRIAKKPADADHPYGHGKAELIAASLVGGFLFAAALDVGYSSIRSLFAPQTAPGVSAAYTALGAIVIKEILFHLNFRIGRKIHRQSLVASAYDSRSDVYSSLAALLGILLSIAGKRFDVPFLLYMDGVAGAVVALLVLKIALRVTKEALQPLMDRVILEPTNLAPYREVIVHVPGVEHIDELRVRDHGSYVIVDVEISVHAQMTVLQGHEVAATVRRAMRTAFPRVQDVFVHVNPYIEGEDLFGRPHD